MEDERRFVLLVDSDGDEMECEIIDRIEYQGDEYCVLFSYADDEDEEPETVILRVTGEDQLSGFGDADILEAVYAIFLEKHKED